MASPMMHSRSTGPSAARPSPRRENGVAPLPLSWMSRRRPSRSNTSPSRIARPSPSEGEKPPNWCPAYAWARGSAPSGTALPASAATPSAEAIQVGSRPSSSASGALAHSSRGAATGTGGSRANIRSGRRA